MTETYTPKISLRVAAKKLDNEAIRLDTDDQLFHDMLRNELDALLRCPQSDVIRKITSYSRAQRTPLM